MLELSSVSYTYPGRSIPALREACLCLSEGEQLCVIGRNASGKSTLCKVAAGLARPSSGSVRIDGLPAGEESTRREIRKLVAFLQQDPESQFVSVTVEREIASGPENLGFSAPEARRIVEELLDFFDLHFLRKEHPRALSGGQMQKVLLASLLAMKPRYLILDEPTSYLDPLERVSIAQELRRVSSQLGTSVVWVTQFLREAFASPRILAMDRGAILFDGAPVEFSKRREVLSAMGVTNPERYFQGRVFEYGPRA